jgi:hypothetical protein
MVKYYLDGKIPPQKKFLVLNKINNKNIMKEMTIILNELNELEIKIDREQSSLIHYTDLKNDYEKSLKKHLLLESEKRDKILELSDRLINE